MSFRLANGAKHKTLTGSQTHLLKPLLISCWLILWRGPGSAVGIATGYGLDGPGIESRWGRDFPHCPYRPWGPPSLLYNGYRVFPGGKERPGRDADPSSLLVPWSRKSKFIPLTPPMGRTDCTEPQCLYKVALYLNFTFVDEQDLWALMGRKCVVLLLGPLPPPPPHHMSSWRSPLLSKKTN